MGAQCCCSTRQHVTATAAPNSASSASQTRPAASLSGLSPANMRFARRVCTICEKKRSERCGPHPQWSIRAMINNTPNDVFSGVL